MSFFNAKSITAKLVGANLVAAFPAANPPLIWKFDLERNHSFTIALQGEPGDWELGITSPKGEFYPVAHFPAREDAEEALDKVQKVLMKKRRSIFWRVMRWIIGLMLLGVIGFVVWSYLVPPSKMLSLSSKPSGQRRRRCSRVCLYRLMTYCNHQIKALGVGFLDE